MAPQGKARMRRATRRPISVQGPETLHCAESMTYFRLVFGSQKFLFSIRRTFLTFLLETSFGMFAVSVLQNNSPGRSSRDEQHGDQQDAADAEALRHSARAARNLHATESTMDPSCRFVWWKVLRFSRAIRRPQSACALISFPFK